MSWQGLPGDSGRFRTNEADIRGFLLSEVLQFVRRACTCSGVTKIALMGSLTTEKRNPKDADLLITVADHVDLAPLASAGQRLKGRAQSRNSGADIFLANAKGEYIGRICHWRECRPGVRLSCDARHCERRQFLHDDLDDVTLDTTLVQSPPIELWPLVICRSCPPSDVQATLPQPLRGR